jgi:hypothetical protein
MGKSTINGHFQKLFCHNQRLYACKDCWNAGWKAAESLKDWQMRGRQQGRPGEIDEVGTTSCANSAAKPRVASCASCLSMRHKKNLSFRSQPCWRTHHSRLCSDTANKTCSHGFSWIKNKKLQTNWECNFLDYNRILYLITGISLSEIFELGQQLQNASVLRQCQLH